MFQMFAMKANFGNQWQVRERDRLVFSSRTLRLATMWLVLPFWHLQHATGNCLCALNIVTQSQPPVWTTPAFKSWQFHVANGNQQSSLCNCLRPLTDTNVNNASPPQSNSWPYMFDIWTVACRTHCSSYKCKDGAFSSKSNPTQYQLLLHGQHFSIL